MSTLDVKPPYITGAPGRTSRLGMLLGQRAGDGGGTHGAGQSEGGHDDQLIAARELDQPLDHRPVEAQWRRRVDDGKKAGPLGKLLLAHTLCDARHLQRIEDPCPAEAVGVVDLIGHHDEVANAIQVPRRRRQVHRFHRIATEQVNDIEHLPQPQEIAVVLLIARPPAAGQVGHVRGAGDGGEVDAPSAHEEAMRRVAGMDLETRGSFGDRVPDQTAVETHALGAVFDLGAAKTQDLEGLGMEKIHADLLQNAKGRLGDGENTLLAQHLHWRIGAVDPSPRQLIKSFGSCGLSPAAPRTLSRHPSSTHSQTAISVIEDRRRLYIQPGSSVI
jgi:hypothetical protein